MTTESGDIVVWSSCTSERSHFFTRNGNISVHSLSNQSYMSIKEAGDLEASLIDGSVSAVVRSGDITMDIEQVCGHKPILFSDAFGSRLGSKSFPVYFSQSQIGVKKFLFTNTPSRFASAVFDSVLGPPRRGQHT